MSLSVYLTAPGAPYVSLSLSNCSWSTLCHRVIRRVSLAKKDILTVRGAPYVTLSLFNLSWSTLCHSVYLTAPTAPYVTLSLSNRS